jgi:hypothetical protein
MTADRSFAACVAGLLLALQLGCGSESPTDGGPLNAATLTAQGWDQFEASDFAQARDKFVQATGKDASYGEAYNGLGWASMKFGSYTEALTAFDNAVGHGVTSADPLAGKAILHRDLDGGNPTQVIIAASAALTKSPGYSFTHDRRLDWRDLRLLLAQARFQQGDYVAANDQVVLLGGNSQDPQSASFIRDLLAELERLGKLLNG